jgi:hypothetical protein
VKKYNPRIYIVTAVAIIMYTIASLGYYLWWVNMNIIPVTNRLDNTRRALEKYREAHGRYPESLDKLDLPDHFIRDPFTGAIFRYSPAHTNSQLPIVEQDSSFRTGLWPFGSVRRYGAYIGGSFGNVCSYEKNDP